MGQFHKSAAYCKDCVRQYNREHTSAHRDLVRKRKREYDRTHPERKRRWYQLAVYGLPSGEFDRLVSEQAGKCAVCSEPFVRTPDIDHDHHTGLVRGLLCRSCNIGIGHVERVGWLAQAT